MRVLGLVLLFGVAVAMKVRLTFGSLMNVWFIGDELTWSRQIAHAAWYLR